MMPNKIIPSIFLICICLLFSQCEKEELLIDDSRLESLAQGNSHNNHMKKPEGAGNCLSFPVIWAEGVAKSLRDNPGVDPYMIEGDWWYSWGTNGSDPNITPASCPPDPDNEAFCDDGMPGQFDDTLVPGFPVADNPMPLAKAYLQKHPENFWEGQILDLSHLPVNIDKIDWGDNLESVDWYTRSQVRTELVLFEDFPSTDPAPDVNWKEYSMRHTSGWGIDEVHGMAADLSDNPIYGTGLEATVYSKCARLTIQKFQDDNPDPNDPLLAWDVVNGEWTGEGIINPAIFNMAVHEAQDGPGYYNAEVNVKGRIIYGYTWNVRRLHDDFGGTAAGKYRITFSFDTDCSGTTLNTFFDGNTIILVPEEEEIITQVAMAESEDDGEGGGGTGVLRSDLNLTYMDINILERGGGGGGGGKPGGGGSGGGGSGGGNGGGRR
jgi:uncharacterized membrane protein YgcG